MQWPNLLLICGVFAAVLGCNANDVVAPAQQEQQDTTEQAAVLDSVAYYCNQIDSGVADQPFLESAAKVFVANDSIVSSSAEYLMKAGLTCLQVPEYHWYGVNYLIRISKKYPSHPWAPEALMQIALFYDNVANDTPKSQEILRLLLERYPNCALAEDAKALLAFMGTTAEELEQVKNWNK